MEIHVRVYIGQITLYCTTLYFKLSRTLYSIHSTLFYSTLLSSILLYCIIELY